ncbi:MAG TPA: PIN domain-containing protein [Patescibacteria group bacterium]|nr:PIN domain-containing protein [Patescibacteria group bacterium]
MVVSLALRLIFGVIFGVLGFILSSNLLATKVTFFLPNVVIYALIAFLAGAFGIFLFPVLSQAIGKWSYRVTESVAKQLAEQLLKLRLTGKPLPDEKVSSVKEAVDYDNPMVMDTSAIIDGRIADIIETGFLHGSLLVPHFVLLELQRIADSSDTLRRGRGRRGLEILEQLKKSPFVEFEILEQERIRGKTVDEKLISVARQLKAKIITTDFNLNKVASVSGVKILNVNELANSVKAVALPGEEMVVKVIQEGKEENQGVGYLPDGTMIVVEMGKEYVGKTVDVVVSRILQTVAGRMIFVQLKASLQTPLSKGR